jgi:hypothetical protein
MTSRTASELLEDLRSRGVRLEADGLNLRVDAPAGAITAEDREALAEAKPQFLKLLHRERKKLEDAARRGLVVRWAREPGYVSLHDPTTGDWHEVLASGCPPWVVDAAKAHSRRKKEAEATQSPPLEAAR